MRLENNGFVESRSLCPELVRWGTWQNSGSSMLSAFPLFFQFFSGVPTPRDRSRTWSPGTCPLSDANVTPERQVKAAGCVLVRRVLGGALEALVIKRGSSDKYEIPKGRLEREETTEEAGERELRQETGLTSAVDIGPSLGVDKYKLYDGSSKTVEYFRCRLKSHASPAYFGQRERMTQELRWISLSGLSAIEFKADAQKRIIKAALTMSSSKDCTPTKTARSLHGKSCYIISPCSQTTSSEKPTV